MVCDTVNPSLRAASCCSVEVVNGGAGVRLRGFFVTSLTLNAASLQLLRNASASSCVLKRVSSSAFTSVFLPSGPMAKNMAFTR